MKFLIVRSYQTRSGIKTEPVSTVMSDQLVLCGPSAEHVLVNARKLGLYGVTAIALDENDRPMAERGAA